MVHYKLSYLNLRGLAEVSRQILAYAGEVFEDHRIEREDWPAIKPTMPFQTLPVLYVDGKPLAQSHAIARYLARQFGLNGKTVWEEAQVNSLADLLKDYQQEIRPYFAAKMGFAEGDVSKLHEEVFVPAQRKYFKFLVDFLKASGSGYLVGDSLTWVDLAVAQHTADLIGGSVLSPDVRVLEEFPELKAHQEKIHAIGRIKKWLELRPKTAV